MPPKSKKIALTGGGTAGHVMPNIAMTPILKAQGWDVFYVGSNGMEKDLVSKINLPYFEIKAGKLRRYLSFQNFLDLFKIFFGFLQAFFILLRQRPNVLFSKGGFVSVPVAYSAFILGIPIVTHESDLTPGLATKLIRPIARRIFFSFPETKKYFPQDNAKLAGAPMREEIFTGHAEKGLSFCGFKEKTLPVLLVMGGSLGAQRVNDGIEKCLPDLIKKFLIIHQTGKGKPVAFNHPNYKQFEFLASELKDIFAATDFVVSRAGANAIFEFLALNKPMLLIPLEIGSRGDQVLNAQSFLKNGWAKVIRETKLEGLLSEIECLYQDRDEIISKQKSAAAKNGVHTIIETLTEVAR